MTARKQISGATLLELIVVMTLMITMLGLVGGSTIESVDRAEAQTEVISVYSLIKKGSMRAFTSGKRIELAFTGSKVKVHMGSSVVSEHLFEHLSFDDQTIVFNRNGFANTTKITVDVRGVHRDLFLHSVFGVGSRLANSLGTDVEG